MKKTLIVFFVLVITGAGIYFYLQNASRDTVDSWQLVPGNAILAYENNSLIDNWNKVIDKSIWETLQKMPYFHHWEKGLSEADSLSGKDGSLDRLFRNRRLIVSVHVISSNAFDFLFNLDLKDEAGTSTFNDVVIALQKDYDLIKKTRTYLGYEIHELVKKSDRSTFTYFVYKNVVIGSYTSFLVEDVVRNIADEFRDTFKARIAALEGITRLENDEGNIYIDYSALPGLLAAFLPEQKVGEMKDFARFSGDTYLDVKVTDQEILFNGATTVNLSSNNSFIGTFRNQEPGPIRITDIIPNTTAVLYHFYVSNFEDWQNQLTRYWSEVDKNQFDRHLDFIQKYDIKLDWMTGEVANAILETPGRDFPNQLVFIGIDDEDLVFDEIRRLGEQLSEVQGDTLYYELYDELPIIQLPYEEFPSVFMGEYFRGFENSFITVSEDYLVIGNSMQAVKLYIQDVDNENVWGKSVRKNIFLENTLGESSFTMMVNTVLCWRMILNNLNARWIEVFNQYEPVFKSFDMMSLQVSNLDQRFYTSIAIGHEEIRSIKSRIARMEKQQSIYTMSPIITKPFIVKNHNNNRFEVLVQDSARILYLISNEGEILWGDSLRQEIKTDIFQVDYFKNGKLQYLFATAGQLHLLDRNGDYVENYPVDLEEGVEAQFLSVVDYDNSKRYRFMVVDQRGNIYLYDKTGTNLEGWTPRKMEGPLAMEGFHLRVRGGDCMVALQKNGLLNVMNRRGQMYAGFPLDLKVANVSGLFVNMGNNFASTRLITVSEAGELIEVNLEGKVLKRTQLYKPARESKFWLVKDALEKNFVIARQEYNKVSFLDNNGETIFEKSLISSGMLSAQYYNFSADQQVFVILDHEQEFAYIYNSKGEQFAFEPLECAFPVSLLYLSRQDEYHLYKCYNNNLTLEAFR